MRILVVPNTANPASVCAASELVTWLLGSGFEPVLSSQDAKDSGLEKFGVQPSDIGEPSLVVALGGDGTILKAVHLMGESQSPVLGVNFGRLGFLSGASADSMRQAVQAALSGEARIEKRATLRADVVMEGRKVGTYRALNEVALSRKTNGRVIAVEVAIDGHSVARMRGDGVIVATATGSTAYALSAGGPVVAPGFGGMVVVPVAPHTLQARSIITEPSHTVELKLPDSGSLDACLVVDGELIPSRRAIESVTLTRGTRDVSLVKLDGRDFYETVATEFFGG